VVMQLAEKLDFGWRSAFERCDKGFLFREGF
jgi:hypothetical protein